MSSTITVRGVGTASAKPDLVNLSLYLEARDKVYENAMKKGSDQIDMLAQAAQKAGFKRTDLKTTSFNVRSEYESVKDKQGNYRQAFAGYVCCHDLKLSFKFDADRLANTLSELSSCGTDAQLNVSFTVKNPAALNARILKDAVKNASVKAAILCEASGVVLGEIKNIEYDWSGSSRVSRTRFEADNAAMPLLAKASFAGGFEPEEIQASDSVTFTWEIEKA